MSISFTGIGKIRVYKRETQSEGSFLNAHNEYKNGTLNTTEVILRFDLNNDAYSNDMDELINALGSAGKGFSYNPRCPNTIELYLKKVVCDDDVVPSSKSFIWLNNQDINISERKELKLYSYLANLVSKICKMPQISPDKHEYITLINEAIKENAVHYIECIM